MRMAVKTSPITAAPPFSVHLTGERERADGFTLSVLAGETALGWTGFARRCASEYTVLLFHPVRFWRQTISDLVRRQQRMHR